MNVKRIDNTATFTPVKGAAKAAKSGAAKAAGQAAKTAKAAAPSNSDTVKLSKIAGAAGAATAAVALAPILGPVALPATASIIALKGAAEIMPAAKRVDDAISQMARQIVDKMFK